MPEQFIDGASVFDLRVGKVTGMHGLKGTLRVRCDFNNPSYLASARNILFTKEGAVITQSEVENMRFEKSTLYVDLKGHYSRDDVEKLVGLDVTVSRSELPELDENEWWVSDLVGVQVYTTKGELIGVVSNVVGERCELLEVTKCGGEMQEPRQEPILVPFVKQLVPVVDLIAGRIEVEPLPGLLTE